jgi:hypothetical protein
MSTKRSITRRKRNKNKTMKKYGGKPGKKWTTAIDAAQKTLKTTRSYEAAKKSLRKQALSNARKLFGSVGSLRV